MRRRCVSFGDWALPSDSSKARRANVRWGSRPNRSSHSLTCSSVASSRCRTASITLTPATVDPMSAVWMAATPGVTIAMPSLVVTASSSGQQWTVTRRCLRVVPVRVRWHTWIRSSDPAGVGSP